MHTVHLLVRREDMPAPVIACGKAVSAVAVLRGRVTHEVDGAACFGCAKEAPGLTEVQRQIIWDRRCEPLACPPTSPWEVAKNKAEREERRAERVKEAAEKRAARAAKQAEREAAKAEKAKRRAARAGAPF